VQDEERAHRDGAERARLQPDPGHEQALPPGFEIKSLRYCPGDDEIVNVLEFSSDKLPNGSQCAVLFKFGSDDLITEERWFVDTEQWKAAF
jgi:hypothetical protein